MYARQRKLIFANRGIKRNKRPLQNILYWANITPLNKIRLFRNESLEQFKERHQDILFKQEGFFCLFWAYEKDYNRNGTKFLCPRTSLAKFKKMIGEKQWAKFCNGKRYFVLQRRVNGRNIQTP